MAPMCHKAQYFSVQGLCKVPDETIIIIVVGIIVNVVFIIIVDIFVIDVIVVFVIFDVAFIMDVVFVVVASMDPYWS